MISNRDFFQAKFPLFKLNGLKNKDMLYIVKKFAIKHVRERIQDKNKNISKPTKIRNHHCMLKLL